MLQVLKMRLSLVMCFATVFYCSQPTAARGINGGIECAACTIVSGILGQVAEIHEEKLVNISLDICDHFSWPSAENVCRKTVKTLEPLIHLWVDLEGTTPDSFCYGLHICHQDPGQQMCHLFPVPSDETLRNNAKLVRKKSQPHLKKLHGGVLRFRNFCDLPVIKDLCIYLKRIFKSMEPAYDFDGDKFSSSDKWRGAHWRGRDCSDFDSQIYPGRQPYYADVNYDSNCNGIWGLDEESGIPWETKLCTKTDSRGIVMFGDSVGAHFHFPSIWFNPKQISQRTFLRNATSALLDELDWPQYSFSTGYKNITEILLIQGQVDSIYLRMRKRNLCNHRDYQNICRNGDNSFDLVKNVKNIARSRQDKPVTMLLGVFGNDVCNWYPDTLQNMTTPKQFYSNLKQIIEVFENTLPNKSHIVLVGLVNGSFIFDTLADRLHPIGEYHGDVRYRDVFKWFECMQISPCIGWLSENKTLRDETTKRATELSHVMKFIAQNYKSDTLSLSYVPNPLTEVINSWKEKGGEVWQLFEPIDGFHPNQISQSIIANVLWKDIKKIAPDALGTINPHNDEILKIFGDQGGH